MAIGDSEFIVVGGYPAQVKIKKANQEVTTVGDVGVTHTGVVNDSRRDEAFEADFTTPCELHDEAWSLRNLIDGKGHTVDFEGGLEASSGLEPLPDDYDLRLDFEGGRWGAAALLSSGSTLTYPAQFLEGWTLIITLRDSADPADVFETFVVRSDGAEWRDGVSGVYATSNFITVDGDGNVVVTANDKAGTPADIYVDEIGMLSFDAADVMAECFDGLQPLSPFPRLTLYGDVIPGSAGLVVEGQLDGDKHKTGGKGGDWQNDLAEVGFSVVQYEEIELERTPLPVSLWTFDAANTSGATVQDVAGVQDATLQNQATSGEEIGRFGHAEAMRPGPSGRASCLNNAAHNITGDLTICAWLKLDSLPGLFSETIASKPSFIVGQSFPFRFFVSPGGGLTFTHALAAVTDSFSSTEVVPSGEWTFVSVTRRGGDVEVRVNCRRDPQGPIAATVVPGASTQGVSIGGLGSSAIDGLVDEVAIFDSALSDAELFAVYLGSLRGERYQTRG